jgi:hypothetical protein
VNEKTFLKISQEHPIGQEDEDIVDVSENEQQNAAGLVDRVWAELSGR